MTKLYHGSLEIVATPEIRRPNRTLDYGEGFYLTSSASQAEAWVRRKFKGDIKLGYVNIYEYDESLEDGFETLAFERPDEIWLDFAMANRTNPDFNLHYS